MKKVSFWLLVCLFLMAAVLLVGQAKGYRFPLVGNTQAAPVSQAVAVARLTPVYDVRGRPSLSPAFVNRVLAAAYSPAQGTGQALYDLSAHYGIDDAYALAFFQHESNFGTTGVARLTHSLGNVKCSPGYACLQGFRAYASWETGYADWYHVIAALYIKQWHLLTVEEIIPVYAPASDGNDVAGYIRAVEQSVARWQKGTV